MTSDPSTLRTSRLLVPAALVLIGVVLLAQFSIPFGWALAGLYIAPVSMCAFWSSFRHVFLVVWIATLCTVLSTVMFFGSPFWDSKVTMAMAYVLPVGSMRLIAVLSVLRKWSERKFKRRANLQTLCSSCKHISTQGKMWTIEQYAKERPGTFLGLGLCNECATKRGVQY